MLNQSNNNSIITTVEEIRKYLSDIGHYFDPKTLDKILTIFKHCMYYCSSDFSNPMFFSMAKKNLLNEYKDFRNKPTYSINEYNTLLAIPYFSENSNLLYIHKMMYHHLSGKGYLKFNNLKKLEESEDIPKFTWNIPNDFMPIVAAYILASYNSEKNNTSSSTFFFDKMDEYSDSFSEKNKIIYTNWAKKYLGREYFSLLDDICKKYSTNPEQTNIILSSVNSLTEILVASTAKSDIEPGIISYCMCLLLKNLKNNLENTEATYLYEHYVPCIIDDENALFQKLGNTFSELTQKIFDFILNSLDLNSTYKIAAKNFQTFKRQLEEQTAYITSETKKALDSIEKTYTNIQNATYESAFILAPRNCKKHMDTLSTAVLNYQDCLQKNIIKFSKKIEWASSVHPEKKNLHLSIDYIDAFKNDIESDKKTLYSKISGEQFKNSPILQFRNPGYLESSRYPTNVFNKNDILRIIYELNPNHSNDYVLNQDLTFPLSVNDVIDFLLNFANTIDTLKN